MANKKIWLVMLVMALTFGFTVLGCVDDDEPAPTPTTPDTNNFDGTWVNYNYLQKELFNFTKEQSKWVYANSPVELKKANINKMVKNIFFTAYSDTDNIESFVTRIFNQIFQIWNAQCTII